MWVLESGYVAICNKEGTLYKNTRTGKKRSKSFSIPILDTASKYQSKYTSKNNTVYASKNNPGGWG